MLRNKETSGPLFAKLETGTSPWLHAYRMSQKQHRMFPQPRILQQISCLFISVEIFAKLLPLPNTHVCFKSSILNIFKKFNRRWNFLKRLLKIIRMRVCETEDKIYFSLSNLKHRAHTEFGLNVAWEDQQWRKHSTNLNWSGISRDNIHAKDYST